MDRVHIPHSSVAISRLGFGCARIFGGSERRVAEKLIDAAMSCGIRHFDTAPAYGSEDVLGSVLADARDITIATKIGIPRYNSKASPVRRVFGPVYRSTLRPLFARLPTVKSTLLRVASKPVLTSALIHKRRLSREQVLRELDDSLRRLRRSTIDLYLLHEPEAIEITDELREVFISLQKDGLIGAFGLAFGASAAELGSFGTVVQCRFPGDAPCSPNRDTTPIYHGVVRFGLQHPPRGYVARLGAGTLIAQALEKHPDATVIFSASTKHQIHQIAECCFR
jgi:aryl-alcohol dehydrogenase-like predicted oxidoreductase